MKRSGLAVLALSLVALAGPPAPAQALIAELSAADVQEALALGAQGVAQEDFGEEWRLPLPDGGEIAVTTPFSRLAFAARQAAVRGEPLTDKQRQEQLERGKGKVQLLVTMTGSSVDFARWFQPVLRVGPREVKPSFTQNERTALRLDERRFAARNVYVFALEGLPLRGTVTLVVQHSVERKVVLQAPIDLSRLR